MAGRWALKNYCIEGIDIMPTKLYKQENGKIFYWETWDDGGTSTIHWGKLGEEGERKNIKNTFFKKTSKLVNEEEAFMRQKGYEEIEEDDLKLVIIQFKVDGFGTENDLNKRHDIEDLMDELLGRTGLGDCDGGEIGSGIMNIFCYVIDTDIACRVIVNTLTEKELISGALIFETNKGEIRLLWPLDYEGKIEYL